MVKKVKGVFLFKITGSGGKENQWIVDLKNGKGSVKNTPGGYVGVCARTCVCEHVRGLGRYLVKGALHG